MVRYEFSGRSGGRSGRKEASVKPRAICVSETSGMTPSRLDPQPQSRKNFLLTNLLLELAIFSNTPHLWSFSEEQKP